MNKIDQYLHKALAQNASDLHLVSGDPVRARVHGQLQILLDEKVEAETLQESMFEIMDGTTQRAFARDEAADFAYDIPDVSRFRVNVFRHLNGIGAIFRAIPSKALTLKQLGMPRVILDLCKQTSGMILVTGKTGSGKSTTLAAMIDEINRTLKGHILTIEDPVEFTHKTQNCLVSQREIGVHSATFAEALHSALREDPDVVLVGEMRDLETISVAVTAAEMGILVMGTLHTNGAAQTVDRIINSFPADKQSHIRTMISTSLRGVVSQQLLPTKGKPGRIAALEVLINTAAVANLIRQGKLDQLETAMQSGGSAGMRTMDSALMALVEGAYVSGREAYQQANNKSKFERLRNED
ncbi:MAG: PilT/PilU family type 4a pilus ATPase [Gammaproteobacteria bacterium]|nr:PilT/PilU family type 4a pilus ATPase [Gammaproteobacteria bacterium]MDH3372477.1 PilT/PilU family type 4a pilus ATPase [Gammaproteobacteria bacterium]MDH3407913.1 PilT/PilU family type 4a pilus ATPase [Gammaproteobacteria bacterium]MDH3551920.1 PilT/PilU family type 4a pilus ATPase [Gammaproteobacteria bacterium]